MQQADLEPHLVSDEDPHRAVHGAYPQRLAEFSLGPQEDWGWFKHLGTTTHVSEEFSEFQNWPEIFHELANLQEQAIDSSAHGIC
jgi:hypothetical protein